METGKEQSITVTATSGLTEDEIEDMIQENEDYLMSLKEDERIERERAKLTRMIREVEKLVGRIEGVDSEEARDARDSAQVAIHEARNALSSRDLEEVTGAVSSLKSAQTVLEAIA